MTVALGILYTRLCVLVQSHDTIYWCTVSIGHNIAANVREVQLNEYNKSNPVAFRLRIWNILLRRDRIIENVTYFRQGCVWLLVVGWLMAAVLTLCYEWGKQVGGGKGKSLPPSSGYPQGERWRCFRNVCTPVPNWT